MPHRSFSGDATLAVALTIGFYAMAVAVAGGVVLAAHFVQVRYPNHLFGYAANLAMVAAALIVWSILPRFGRFAPPGPQLEEHAQPELFALIRDVAAATGQPMPREVYLVAGVEAAAGQRGGIGAGIGARRVLILGLAALHGMTVAELRAVIAHELGHYRAGALKSAAWIHTTREAIFRTIESIPPAGVYLQLGSRRTSFYPYAFLHALFIWYGKHFLRVTQAIARAHELAADRLASDVAGARTAMTALVNFRRSALAFAIYWKDCVLPVLTSGHRPPIGAGFEHFMSIKARMRMPDDVVGRELSSGNADEYDSHPSLQERCAAFEALADFTAPVAESPLAATLLRDADALEATLLRTLHPAMAKLREIRWPEVASAIVVPSWRDNATRCSAAFRGVKMAGVITIAPTLPGWIRGLDPENVMDAEPQDVATVALGCTIATRLIDEGWLCGDVLGRETVVSKNGRTIAPFAAARRLIRCEMTRSDWARECTLAGIGDLPLA